MKNGFQNRGIIAIQYLTALPLRVQETPYSIKT